MAVGVGIGVRKLPLFAKIFHCFFLSQVSLHVSDCAALYMLQKFAFAKRMERIFCESSECSCEWIEKRTSSSLLMLLFLPAFLDQLIKVAFVQPILCDSVLFIFALCVRFRVCHQNRTGALKQLPAGQDRKPPSRVFQSSSVRGTRRLAKSSARSRNESTSRPIASNSSFLR